MAINKVAYGDQTLLDLTEDTVTADKVLEGETFHDKSGVLRSGNLVIPVQDVEVNGESVVNSENVAEIDIPTTDIQTAVDEFETYNGGLLSECKVALSPNQDLHGYSEPWVGGAGKNKLNSTLVTASTKNGITCTPQFDDGGNLIGYQLSGTATANADFQLHNAYGSTDVYIPSGTYKANNTGAINGIEFHNGYGNASYPVAYGNTDTEITCLSGISWTILRVANGTVINTPILVQPMIRLATETDPTFEPYSNICPISGHTQVEVDVSDGQTTQEQVTVNLGGTYYSGTLDVVTGVFTPDTAKTTINDCISNRTTSYDHPVFYGTISGLKNGNPIMYSDKLRIIEGKSSASAFASDSENGDFANNSYNTGASIQVFLRMDDYSDVPSLKSAIGDAEIVYELATPQSIQLSPTMVKALVGENHLSAPLDGQEITESKYRELFTWDEVEEIAQKIADSKIDNLNTSYDTTFSSAFTEARYVKKIYGAPVLTALQIVLSGAPSITFNHQLIFSDAQTCCELIQFGSGARIGITDVAISQGSVTFTFDSPLTKAIGFRCRITNDFVS